VDDVVQAVLDRVTDAAARHDATQEDRLDRCSTTGIDTGPRLTRAATGD
jgi:hypothetical protein